MTVEGVRPGKVKVTGAFSVPWPGSWHHRLRCWEMPFLRGPSLGRGRSPGIWQVFAGCVAPVPLPECVTRESPVFLGVG